MDSMRALGVKPNRQTFNTLIAAYGHGQQWERAEAMLRDEAWQATGLERDARSYNALIAACERADTPQWQRAEVSGTSLFCIGGRAICPS
jgi:pentatricopeptide repeat protein